MRIFNEGRLSLESLSSLVIKIFEFPSKAVDIWIESGVRSGE